MSAPSRTSTSDPIPFDIRGPLPSGTTLLEASAGTGKTWTIGALVTRYVAEGHARLDEMLVVTFGRAASHELRERVREHLVRAESALGASVGGAVGPGSAYEGDALLDHLLDADEDERGVRRRRLRVALADFDAATIATTHQFCSMVLDSLGVAGDTDSGVRLVEDLSDLVDEVVDDLYLRKFAYADATPEFSRKVAGEIAAATVGDPRAELLPTGANRASGPGLRHSFATKVREEMERRKRRLGILSYDDLLGRLADALEADDSPARARMRQRWRVVLVDEFQDTDPVQWEVLDRAFTGHATMVLIGDPKQAIYAFRGGDVFAYLAAARTATTRMTLDVNWRSDRPYLDALEVLLGGAALGDQEIVVRPVTAHHPESRLVGAPRPAPLRMRVLRREDFGGGSGLVSVKDARPRIAEDLALDIRALLDSGATYDGRPIEARDVAVIAYRHADLAAARDALHQAGVRAVIAGGGSVYATPAALEWLALLEALEQPHRTPRVRSAALTSFLGYAAAELDSGGDGLTDAIADRLRDWAELLGARGVAAIFEAAGADGLSARLLGEVEGERRLTDLRQLAEALHQAAMTDRLGVVALVAWLRRKIADAREGRADDRTRRLDSDEAAVQLVTIHASKGLEYPVVYLPALADRWVPDAPDIPLFHDAAGRRSRQVGAGGDGWDDAVARHDAEESGEWLRLLYVALTRAKSQVVCWWAPSRNVVRSPLHRVLSRAPGSSAVPDAAQPPRDPDVVELFARWRDAGALSPEPVRPALASAAAPEPVARDLAVRRFTRTIDPDWRRASYSSLSAVESPAGVASEPEQPPLDDESAVVLPVTLAGDPMAEAAGAVVSPMASLPVGATFGSLVHGVLEHADPAAPLRGGDLRADIRHHVVEQLVRWPVELDIDELTDALVAVCDSPLGPLADGLTLRGLPMTDRLREMDFELPLAGGDTRGEARREVRLGQVAGLLRDHLSADDPVRPYAERLDQPALGGQVLHGYLTGSIDVALRVGTSGDPRYLVVDYKTNWLGGPLDQVAASPLSAHDYRPEALAEAMTHSDYPLQALLYSLVLHRFLRWRQPGYDPERHLGGVLYLYLRGMCGPETPMYDGHPAGVFSWRPPVSLVTALSDLVDGRPL